MRPVEEKRLREYAGVYQWDRDAYAYLQMWNELAGSNQLVAFDESGEVRTLYPTDRDRFFAGPGAGSPTAIEARIDFERDSTGAIIALHWLPTGGTRRTARRVHIERNEEVRFSNGAVELSGTLFRPIMGERHPAMILVHGSGAATREQILPWTRFLVRRGMAILAYDKRGVGGSSGDWKGASFEDLASDVIAAFEYLKSRPDVDSTQIGLFGVSQAGWIMPIAAVRAKGIAFLISVSGAGVPVAETTIDQAQNEMRARGMKQEIVQQIVAVMRLQYEFARTGQGWDAYAAARERLAARLGRPPDTFPATPDDPHWAFIRRLYFYDPGPTLRRLRVPTLAIFGELDNNILAGKNSAAWDAALRDAGNRDYTLRILPKANHIQLEATVGSNAEMPSLRRFVPSYYTTILEWLEKRIRGFGSR
ncbi:MAG TPA: alpha/beta hydrolase [Vicinamibacterales bacterium]|nr:alpha/beta hydrolase [Vicinamibacterales bacterium]